MICTIHSTCATTKEGVGFFPAISGRTYPGLTFFVQQILNGLTIGSVYALVALGLTLVYGILAIPNFSHGALFTIGAYAAFAIIERLHAGFWLALVGAAAVAAMIWTLPRWVGPMRAKADKLPPWSLYRLVNGAGFMLSCSALVKAGVQIPEILRILQRGMSMLTHSGTIVYSTCSLNPVENEAVVAAALNSNPGAYISQYERNKPTPSIIPLLDFELVDV